MQKEKISPKSQKYLEELASGRHHAGMPEKPRKHERNKVFVSAAIAAGFSETSAKNHKTKIDNVIGFERLTKAYELGKFTVLGREFSPKKKRKKEEEGALPQIFQYEKIEFGNKKQIAIANAVGVVGRRGVRFLEIRGEYSSDYAAMIAAGFSEVQARNPGRLRALLGRLDPAVMMDAVGYFGIDSVKIAEVLAHFLDRKEVVKIVDPETGEVRMEENPDRIDGASANMALGHLKDFMRMFRDDGGLKEDRVGVEVSESVQSRVAGLLRGA